MEKYPPNNGQLASGLPHKNATRSAQEQQTRPGPQRTAQAWLFP